MSDSNRMILIAAVVAAVASVAGMAVGAFTPDQWWHAVTRAAPWLAGLL